MAEKKQNEPKKTVKKETASQEQAQVEEQTPAAESANGTPVAEAAPDGLQEKTAEIADTYEKAKEELEGAVARLRYEMSKLDVKQVPQQARTWVEENPTLAVLLAVGAGLIAGRLLAGAMKPAPPPPLAQRLKARGRSLATQARHYAHDVGDVVSEHAADVGDEIARRARALGEDVTRRARELGEDVTHHAADVLSSATAQAAHLGEVVQEDADTLVGAARTGAGRSFDVAESVFNAAKTIAAAFIVKKVTDWIRR